MNTSRKTLKKVGKVLLIVGVIDIGVMAYCIANQISYSSSFNIFSVIAGILLMKGGLKTAGIVTFFSAFMLVGFVGLMVISLFIEPFELKAITFKLNPVSTIFTYAFMLMAIGFIYWVYKNLVSESVMTARKEAGLSHKPPKLAFILGGVLVVVISIFMYFINNSPSAAIAKAKAQEQLGSAYKYHITAMNFSGKHVIAHLTAYREGEIKQLSVEWNQ